MNENTKLIEEQFQKLPPALQEAIKAVPWKSIVNEITLLNGLGLDQVEIVERETMFVIYGFESPESYTGNIVREATLEEGVANTIAETVSDRVLGAISSKVAELEKASQPPAPAIPATTEARLPVIEPGEVAHEVPHQETPAAPSPVETPKPTVEIKIEKPKPTVAVPDYRYPSGTDPYREPV